MYANVGAAKQRMRRVGDGCLIPFSKEQRRGRQELTSRLAVARSIPLLPP
jgi:hypothetical protein